MSTGRICVREVDIAEVDESVQAAAQRMNSRNVGALVVLDQEKRPLGMLTDRDLAVRVLAKAVAPNQTTVGEVMTKSLQMDGFTAACKIRHSRSGRRTPRPPAAGRR